MENWKQVIDVTSFSCISHCRISEIAFWFITLTRYLFQSLKCPCLCTERLNSSLLCRPSARQKRFGAITLSTKTASKTSHAKSPDQSKTFCYIDLLMLYKVLPNIFHVFTELSFNFVQFWNNYRSSRKHSNFALFSLNYWLNCWHACWCIYFE